MSDKKPLIERSASWMRFALLAAIAVVLGLIITTPRNEYPLVMSRAQAEGISAVPDYICTLITATSADRFYLIDTNKRVICVYSLTNDQLRLQSARRFDHDVTIPDGFHPVTVGGKSLKLEGNSNGLSREEAKDYGEAINKLMDAAK